MRRYRTARVRRYIIGISRHLPMCRTVIWLIYRDISKIFAWFCAICDIDICLNSRDIYSAPKRGLLFASRMVVHRVLVGVVVCACEHAERGGRRVPPLCVESGRSSVLQLVARSLFLGCKLISFETVFTHSDRT